MKPPKLSQKKTMTPADTNKRESISMLLSSTTVPATVSNGTPVLLVITPHLASSPALGSAKFVM
ncbi:hypothetical protein DSECCO2_629020 [anaerobic digester metagenome]